MSFTIRKIFSTVLLTVCIVFGVEHLSFGQQGSLSTQGTTSIGERTPQVRDAIVMATGRNAADIYAIHLRKITSLDLSGQSITSLKSGDFSGLTALTHLNLEDNELNSLPAGIFTDLMALETLRLDRNRIEPLPITISLQKVAESQFKVVVQTGALFDIVVPINVTSGKISDGATQVIIPKGSVESRIFTVSRLPNTRAAVTVEIGTLPECPVGYSGCVLTSSEVIPLELMKKINTAPMFKEGWLTTRVVMDRNFVGASLGKPITAIDVDGDPLTYTLSGIDAQAFTLDSEGYLKTRTLLDSTHKSIYTVRVTASDDIDTDVITVVITLADANNPFKFPNFIPVLERTPQVRDAIVSALSDIRDADDVTLAHLATIRSLNLRGRGISELKLGDFSGLVALTDLNLHGNYLSTLPDGIFNELPALRTLRLGRNVTDQMILPVQLLQVGDDQYKAVVPTGAAFDMVLPVSVTNGIISDGPSPLMISQGSRESDIFSVACPLGRPISPSVSLNILPKRPRNHYGYIFAQSTVYNRTPQVTKAITDAVPGITDPRYVTDLHLVTISNLSLNYGTITSLKTGDFAGLFALKTLSLNDNKLSSLPDNIFDGLMSLTHLDLSGNEFTDFSPKTFEKLPYLNSLHLGINKLTYLSEGMFENITELERLHMDGNLVDPLQLWVTLERVEDGQFKAVIPTGIPFEIDLPLIIKNGKMAQGGTTIRISAGTVESYPITVTRNDDTPDAVTVDIGTLPSQPIFHTGYVLAKSDTLRLEVISTIELPPVFTEGEATVRTVPENTSAGIKIGAPITATDPNNDDRLVYTLGGPDASSFNIDSQAGQLKTKAVLDYETKDTYTVIVNVSDGNTEDVSITVTINVIDVNESPVFTEGSSTTLSIDENTEGGINIGSPITATDPDGGTLTYSISGPDGDAFTIDSGTGQLQTKDTLDYETQSTYTVIITVADQNGESVSITVTINIIDINEPSVNRPLVFTEDSSITLSIDENTEGGINIGSPITATDPDGDTLTYSISGPDAVAFTIDSGTGQLRTKDTLDYETKSTYTVIITVADQNGESVSITVTINVIDVNESPVFTEGSSTTLSIDENAESGINIGSPITATDPDGDTLTYSLGGTDANAFSIDSNTAQLQTSAALDYEGKASYTATITATDGKGGTTSTNVTINITDIDEQPVIETPTPISEEPENSAPVFTEGSSTIRSIAENTESGIDIGSPIAATDAEGDPLSYSLDSNNDVVAFSLGSSTGQLQTYAALDYETQSTYFVTITADDGKGGSASIAVRINITDIDEQPVSETSIPIIEQPQNEAPALISEPPQNEAPAPISEPP